MPNREHLQKEILVLTEIIKDNRVAVRSRTMPPETKELLRQAIVQREATGTTRITSSLVGSLLVLRGPCRCPSASAHSNQGAKLNAD